MPNRQTINTSRPVTKRRSQRPVVPVNRARNTTNTKFTRPHNSNTMNTNLTMKSLYRFNPCLPNRLTTQRVRQRTRSLRLTNRVLHRFNLSRTRVYIIPQHRNMTVALLRLFSFTNRHQPVGRLRRRRATPFNRNSRQPRQHNRTNRRRQLTINHTTQYSIGELLRHITGATRKLMTKVRHSTIS